MTDVRRPSLVRAVDVAHFRTFGFVVLRNVFDATALRRELDVAIADGSLLPFGADVGTSKIQVKYVPMMCASTHCSLALLDQFQTSAAVLLDGPVLPVRAKGMHYFGGTGWHCDSRHEVASVGFAAYLECLNAENGALRVSPGSHRGEFGDAVAAYVAALDVDAPVATLPGFAIPTGHGDVIAFDEHLFHASSGGNVRRQWRVDYVRDPTSAEEEEKVRTYFANIFPARWDGNYDSTKFPSYGRDWLDSERPAVERLRELGVYEMAAMQEKRFVQS
ncbi:MAG: phytanoyl-CoA dioxygenase family protein [Myxococcota bacterium]|nr:phytanoyl-CoA dioxygenase family protein [Myxococcota bacterium]